MSGKRPQKSTFVKISQPNHNITTTKWLSIIYENIFLSRTPQLLGKWTTAHAQWHTAAHFTEVHILTNIICYIQIKIIKKSWSCPTLIHDLGTRWEWVANVTPRPRFSPGERTHSTHCTGGWVGLRAGLNTGATGKILSPLPGIEPRSPRRTARSRTLYWATRLTINIIETLITTYLDTTYMLNFVSPVFI
jgi:hypothetical protein